MADSRFTDSRKRIERATMHAKALTLEWARISEHSAYATVVEDEDERTSRVKLVCPPDILDNSLALELGEFFYQLRAALDVAMWQGVTLASGAEPSADANRLYFPIYTLRSQFKDAAFNKAPLPQELKSWLETIQPYFTGEAPDKRDAKLGGVLQTIHDCARKDRHRRLHVVASIPTEITYAFEFDPPALTAIVEPIPCNFLEGESYFLRVGIEPASLPVRQHVKFTTDVTLEIACDEIPVYGEEGLGGELKRFLQATRYVVDRFEGFF